ncbi:hypothetical protein [Cumulibacter soli]|uniref:hypothetical protein n=1 Tax=Cumulibacter soli TaxID=2546344 RepID=UPI001067BC77|nr:hypothetical protein [Cumulibacter soli]
MTRAALGSSARAFESSASLSLTIGHNSKDIHMYGVKPGAGAVAGSSGALAATGFPMLGLGLLAMILLVVGAVLLRMSYLRRHAGT